MEITQHVLYPRFPNDFNSDSAIAISDKESQVLKGYIDNNGNCIVFNKKHTNFQFYTNNERMKLYKSLNLKVNPKFFLPYYNSDHSSDNSSTSSSASLASSNSTDELIVQPKVQRKKQFKKKQYSALEKMKHTQMNLKKFFNKESNELFELFNDKQESKWDAIKTKIVSFVKNEENFKDESKLLELAQIIVSIAYVKYNKK